MKTYKIIFWLLTLPTATALAEPARIHTVQANETLFCLAGEYLGNPYRWPELLNANPHIASPESLEIGDRLALPDSARYPAASEFICRPRWIAQGWREAPTAERAPQVAASEPARQLSLALDVDLHAKPSPVTAASVPGAAADPVAIPVGQARPATTTFIRPAPGGAFYIVSGGQLAESPKRNKIALGRTIVVDRTLVD